MDVVMFPFLPCDRLVVMDIEATCDDGGLVPRTEMEVIEIGAVLVDAVGLVSVDEFQSFVRPIRHRRLTTFCRQLTSISQLDVDAAPGFPEVTARLRAWMYRHGATVFGSWGDYDQRQMQQDCELHQIPNPMPGRHWNLKVMFSQARGISKKLGLAEALGEAQMPFLGTHHRGIDDALNITRLLPVIFPEQASRS
jgi:inhibitor of KinA sporulation pathway (predicted exonuclease)